MTKTDYRTADQVAELYGVGRATVYRWVKQEAFDPMPTVLPSPSGERDRLLFDAAAVAKQYEDEMLTGISAPTLTARLAKLKAFRG